MALNLVKVRRCAVTDHAIDMMLSLTPDCRSRLLLPAFHGGINSIFTPLFKLKTHPGMLETHFRQERVRQ
jgi:hypothetical protein